jgi:hypothetical protein
MGLKGYRLWAMGQLDSNVQRPTPAPGEGSGVLDLEPKDDPFFTLLPSPPPIRSIHSMSCTLNFIVTM